jgi:hypothetical protein
MFVNQNGYGASSSASPYAPRSSDQLQFFGTSPGASGAGGPAFYSGAGGPIGAAGSGGSYAQGNMDMGGQRMTSEGKWWEAFGTGGFEGEASLMEGE